MTEGITLALLVSLGPITLILGFFFWMHWKENRPGGATDYHQRRIHELCHELDRKPYPHPSKMSWKQAIDEVNWLEDSLRRKRRLEVKRNQMPNDSNAEMT